MDIEWWDDRKRRIIRFAKIHLKNSIFTVIIQLIFLTIDREKKKTKDPIISKIKSLEKRGRKKGESWNNGRGKNKERLEKKRSPFFFFFKKTEGKITKNFARDSLWKKFRTGWIFILSKGQTRSLSLSLSRRSFNKAALSVTVERGRSGEKADSALQFVLGRIH